MSLSSRLFAATYDRSMAGMERRNLAPHRSALLGRARGAVLEIGAGTGANLPFYGTGVDDLVCTEPLEPMARRLERRLAAGTPVPARLVRAAAESLPFEDASFDFAVATLVLCSVEQPEQAVAELRRVLRPGGQLLLLEHVRSEDERLARWQDRLNGFSRCIGQGCNCNRPTVETVGQAGFSVEGIEHHVMTRVPPVVRTLAVGAATRP